VAKAVIPREVAEVIECLMEEIGIETIDVAWAVAERLIGNRIENAEINDRAQSIAKWIYATPGSMDVLMQALVNGYDIERTPVEELREYYENLRVHRDTAMPRSYPMYRARMIDIKRTIEIIAQEYPELNGILCESGGDGE
jgi:hypothetical protein